MPDRSLLDKYRSTFEKALQRLTADIAEDDVAGRAEIHARMRESNENIIAQNAGRLGPEGARTLREVLEDVIAKSGSGAPASEAVPEHAAADEPGAVAQTRFRPTPPASVITGVVVGIGISVLTALGLSGLGIVKFSVGAETTDRLREFESKYARSLPKVEVAADFLAVAEQEIILRQQTDGAALAAIAGEDFVQIARITPDLASRMPVEMPGNTFLMVRADAQAYKIIFRSALCTTVEFTRPDLIDRMRKGESFGCEFFGVWNEQGSKF